MYQEKLVCAIKHNGRVLREQGDTVFLPFGCEYTLFFKNLNSLRALVRVSVDGQDATKGTSLIVPANGTVELERFLEAGNLIAGNRFKFIERTSKIEEGPRGIKVDDGLVRIEFEFEKQPAKVEYEVIKRNYIDEYHKHRLPWTGSPQGPFWNINGGTLSSTADLKMGLAQSAPLAQNASLSSNSIFRGASTASFAPDVTHSAPTKPTPTINDIGITVPGSVSEQKFEVGSWFATDGQKHVMVLKLLGTVGEKPVTKPVTVKTKPKCTTCGHVNKATSKFCSECGTGLVLV